MSTVINVATSHCLALPSVNYDEQLAKLATDRHFAELDSFFDRPTQIIDKYADCLLIVGDHEIKEQIPVNKMLLAVRSPVFRAMFEQEGVVESSKVGPGGALPEVRILDISAGAMRELVRFVCTGKVQKLCLMGAEILVAADKV